MRSRRTRRSDPLRSRWSEGRGPRGMRASKARAGLRAGKPCHRRWSAYGTLREYSEAPLHTRGGSRMPELGPYGSVRGARSNARPYRDHWSELALNLSVVNDRAARLAAIPAGESPANRGVQSLL